MGFSDPLPSGADVEFYATHGWWISPRIFSDEQIDEAADAVQRYYAGDRDHELPASIKRYLNWDPGQSGQRLAKDDYVLLQSESLRRLGTARALGAIAGRLAQTGEIRVFASSLIRKPAAVTGDAAKVGWHVDRAYWQTCTSDRMLTAWIPLHDCEVEMGPITMLDGSHRWPTSPEVEALRAGTTFISDDVASVERRLREAGVRIDWVPMALKKGQVSFHSCLTFHGSGVNRAAAPRISLTVHLQDQANSYRRASKANGEPVVHNTDLLVRQLEGGEPDYRDPLVCPVIWRSS